MTLYQIPSSQFDWSKDIVTRGRGYFALYGYSNNLKKSFPPKVFGQFSNDFVKMFLGKPTLFQILLSHVDWTKNMAARGQVYLAFYGSSENVGSIFK